MKYKLTKVFTTEKDKEGNPLKTKDGRPYTRMALKVEEYGDKWISGFMNPSNKFFKEGQQVEINIEQKGEYLNFSMPNVWDAIKELRQKVKVLEDMMVGKGEAEEIDKLPEVEEGDYPNFE